MTRNQLDQMQDELTRLQVQYYINNELFTWRWWLLVAMTILPWLLWYYFRKKEKQTRLFLGGVFVGLLSVVADIIGTQFSVWGYQLKLIPSIPPLIPYDLTFLPIEYIYIQQISKNKKQFLWIAILLSAMNAFIAEPLLTWIGIYRTHSWKEIYSFPIYFLFFWVPSIIVTKKEGWKDIY